MMNAIKMLSLAAVLMPTLASAAEKFEAVEVVERVEAARPGDALREIGTNRIVITKGRARIQNGLVANIYDAEASRYTVLHSKTSEWFSVDAARLRPSGVVPPAAVLGMGVDADTGNPVVPETAFRLILRTGNRSTWQTTTPAYDGSIATMTFDETSIASWAALETLVFDVFTEASSPLRSWLRQVSKMRGYPIEVDQNGPRGELRTTVVSMRRISVSEDEFTAPSTYTETSDPNRLSGKARHR